MAVIYKKITSVNEIAELSENAAVFINDNGKLRQIKISLLAPDASIEGIMPSDEVTIVDGVLGIGEVDVAKLVQKEDVELVFDAGTSEEQNNSIQE